MANVRFPPKFVTICSGEKVGFDYKNNHRGNKFANFWLDIIGKINCKMLVFISYTSSELGSRNFQLVWKNFK